MYSIIYEVKYSVTISSILGLVGSDLCGSMSCTRHATTKPNDCIIQSFGFVVACLVHDTVQCRENRF